MTASARQGELTLQKVSPEKSATIIRSEFQGLRPTPTRPRILAPTPTSHLRGFELVKGQFVDRGREQASQGQPSVEQYSSSSQPWMASRAALISPVHSGLPLQRLLSCRQTPPSDCPCPEKDRTQRQKRGTPQAGVLAEQAMPVWRSVLALPRMQAWPHRERTWILAPTVLDRSHQTSPWHNARPGSPGCLWCALWTLRLQWSRLCQLPRRSCSIGQVAASRSSFCESFAQPEDGRHRDCQGEGWHEKHGSGFWFDGFVACCK